MKSFLKLCDRNNAEWIDVRNIYKYIYENLLYCPM